MSQFEGKAGGGFLSPSPPSSPQHMAHSHIHSSAEQLGFGVSSNPSHSESCCEGTAVQPLIFPQKDSHWYNAWLAARSISVAFCSLHLREKPLNCDGHSFPFFWAFDRVAQAKCRPTEDHLMWSTMGCLFFLCYTLQTQQCKPSHVSPSLCFSLLS